ncbi:MAG: hypothetical protein IKE21_01435 [Erysipelotrichaceae bacterium]|nr:hypothetical protein [Erysipelotrichaceae bacterium]
MKKDELKKKLKSFSKEELEYLAGELYRLTPKKVREEKGYEELLEHLPELSAAGKAFQKGMTPEDTDALLKEAAEFIMDVKAGYYFSANRYVTRAQRYRWRTYLKDLVRRLNRIKAEGDEGRKAANCLCGIYEVMAVGTHRWLFPSQEPFYSCGMKQIEFFEQVARRLLQVSTGRITLHRLLTLAVEPDLGSPFAHHDDYLRVLCGLLKTPDSKESAVEEAMALVEESRKRRDQKTAAEAREAYAFLVLLLELRLCEYEVGIDYYQENSSRSPGERTKILLRELRRLDLKEQWLEIIARAYRQNVSLSEEYEEIWKYLRNEGTFPEEH